MTCRTNKYRSLYEQPSGPEQQTQATQGPDEQHILERVIETLDQFVIYTVCSRHADPVTRMVTIKHEKEDDADDELTRWANEYLDTDTSIDDAGWEVLQTLLAQNGLEPAFVSIFVELGKLQRVSALTLKLQAMNSLHCLHQCFEALDKMERMAQ